MTTKRELDADSPAAILATDPVKRLDAIIRRHGGKPTTETASRVVLPTPPGESAKASSHSTTWTWPMTSPRDCQCPRVRHHHGTDAAYDRDNCRCLPCRLAHSRDHAAYRAGRKPGRPSRLVDATGTRRRIEALAVMGHSSGAIASQIGCSPNAVRKLRYGDTVNVTTAEKITTVYDRLAMTRCTSRDGKNSRTLALRAGCLGPLAWDDDTIDDPAASPASPGDRTSELDEVAISEAMTGRLVHLTRRERTEAVRRLTEQGLSAADIGDRLHITGRTVTRRRTAA